MHQTVTLYCDFELTGMNVLSRRVHRKKTVLFSFLIILFLGIFTTLSGQIPSVVPLSFQDNISGESIPFISLPPFDQQRMRAEDAENDPLKGPYRFGYNYELTIHPLQSGSWINTKDGSRIWRIRIQSEGAQTLNLGFSSFHLPDLAQLFVYTPDHKLLQGPFTSLQNGPDGEMGTDLLVTSDLIVEYDEPAGVTFPGTFILFRITHGYRALEYARSYGQSGICLPNVNCPEGKAWSDQKRAVLCIVSGGNVFCSAALVNNSANDGTPYVLTANHCGTATGSWIFRFNWEAPGCDDPGISPSAVQSLGGAVPLASNPASDFGLCRINMPVPASFHVFYAGWDATGVPADSVCGIHHPSGDIKKISLSGETTTPDTYSNASVWKTGTWREGCTESGSSGSPLFDQNRRIIGQLCGGPSYCGAPTSQCFDYYGSFAVSWSFGNNPAGRLSDWLDPVHNGSLTNNGFDPGKSYSSDTILHGFGMYPNPAWQEVTLQFAPGAGADAVIRLYNLLGEEIIPAQSLLIKENRLTLRVDGLLPGVYLVSAKTAAGTQTGKMQVR
jgi:lysyl endopeptidase